MALRAVVSVSLLLVLPVIAGAQPAEGGAVARTPWGDPDLQAVWDYRTLTPVERPEEFGDKAVLTDEEAAELEAEAIRNNVDRVPPPGSVGGYNRFWLDFGTNVISGGRTSLIIDPPDGRIPPLSAEGEARIARERAERSRRGPANSPDTYSDLSPWTRCISRGWNGIGSWYSSNYQIFQSPGYVVVYQELIHEPRIIPLDGRPHLPPAVRQWLGDSRGRWEGDTLVVETTNFDPKTNFRGSRDTLYLTERYRRLDDDTIDYRFTIDDPQTFQSPWTVVRPMTRITDRVSIFEYACHEGNYSMEGILAGARAQER